MRSAADRHNDAVALRIADRSAEALSEIEALLATGFDAPETRLVRAHLLGDNGRYDEAVDAYRTLLARQPELIDAHETLAQLLPQIGRGAEALDSYRDALRRAPGIGALWLSALGMARKREDSAQLIEWCDVAERQFGPDTLVTTLRAQALSLQDRDADALALIDRALAVAPGHQPLHTTRAHVTLKLGDATAARVAAMQAAQLAPEDQTAWALLSVALRLLDDPRETWLTDYDTHVCVVSLDDIDLGATATALTALHTTRDHPAEQSLRGGTQTRGNLFERRTPEIVALHASIARAVDATLAALGHNPRHPFLRRNTGRARFLGSWSVRLRGEGFHISHVHPAGWLSSACYIALPPEVGEGDAGALAFGVPDANLKLDLPPRRIVRPVAGQLVLFPSFMWHGTIPFDSALSRLTVAFDALPVDNSPNPA